MEAVVANVACFSSSFCGHGVPIAEVRTAASLPIANMEGQVVFVRHLPKNMSSMDGLTGIKSTAGIDFEFAGARKPRHPAKYACDRV